jgi:hypothetical protein
METVGLGLCFEVEVLFTNLEFLAHESDIKRRLAPDIGLAFLHMEMNVENPVFAGGTVYAECEIIEACRSRPQPRPRPHRVRVVKQDGTPALTYTPLRMLRCRDSESAARGGKDSTPRLTS